MEKEEEVEAASSSQHVDQDGGSGLDQGSSRARGRVWSYALLLPLHPLLLLLLLLLVRWGGGSAMIYRDHHHWAIRTFRKGCV